MSTDTQAERVDSGTTLDPVIHPAHRLRICAALDEPGQVEFSALRDIVGVSDSVLSKQIAALVGAGYLQRRKAVRAGRSRVWLSLTPSGRHAFASHVRALRVIVGD